MKTLVIFLNIFLSGSLAFSVTADRISTVYSGQSIATASAAGDVQVLAKTVSNGSTFYLTHIGIEGFFNVPSATATLLGKCSLQIPAGTTVAQFNFNNPTTSQVDRVVWEPTNPIAVPSSFAISCNPRTATNIWWNANYTGFQYP